jgi:hypothetical protein
MATFRIQQDAESATEITYLTKYVVVVNGISLILCLLWLLIISIL